MIKVLSIVGTRPEVIKMAPVIHQLHKEKQIKSFVASTAQHREILDQMLAFFEIKPDFDLNIMEKNQSLPELTAKLPIPLDNLLREVKPDIVLAQGDTTTAFLVSLACFYRKIPFGHVEAGLRTRDRFDPFPEEMNRTLISQLASFHFAPTQGAVDHLLSEGIKKDLIYLTGNTCIDALGYVFANEKGVKVDEGIDRSKKLILVTTHRRENWGDKLEQICEAIKQLADRNEGVQIVLPIHPNPNVRGTILSKLGGHPRILLVEPLSYEKFVILMKRAYLILSDSGGVQEEAPSLGTPVLILRETTERPEACEVGAAHLVGTKAGEIVAAAQELLDDPRKRQAMVVKESPFGDGRAASRIVEVIRLWGARGG